MITAASPVVVDPLDPPHVVAAALGISTQTLANWRCTQRNPLLPYIRLGRAIRYRRSVWQSVIAAAEAAAP
ncbi:MAG: helix-turn-helix domain-containing protein [Casimicrobiaceae bacterium]